LFVPCHVRPRYRNVVQHSNDTGQRGRPHSLCHCLLPSNMT